MLIRIYDTDYTTNWVEIDIGIYSKIVYTKIEIVLKVEKCFRLIIYVLLLSLLCLNSNVSF